jgi:hypothetical protein
MVVPCLWDVLAHGMYVMSRMYYLFVWFERGSSIIWTFLHIDVHCIVRITLSLVWIRVCIYLLLIDVSYTPLLTQKPPLKRKRTSLLEKVCMHCTVFVVWVVLILSQNSCCCSTTATTTTTTTVNTTITTTATTTSISHTTDSTTTTSITTPINTQHHEHSHVVAIFSC